MLFLEQALEGRGFDADDVLFGSSICPDEINHETGDIPDLLQASDNPFDTQLPLRNVIIVCMCLVD